MEKSGMSLLSFSEAESSPDSKGPPAIFLRKLPSSSDREAVRNILLFAKDLIDCELVPSSKYPEDKGFASAVARFRTLEGAKEARNLLNGKRNASNDANIIVDLIPDGLGLPGTIGSSRRNTVDSTSARQGSVSTASGISANGPNGRQSSRYNGTFQTMEKMSPPNSTPGLGNGEFPVQSLFSPTSPVSTSFNHRNLGKSVINDEGDDETEGLLKESIGFGTGSQPSQAALTRRPTNPSIPVSRFSALSLNTNGTNGMSSPPLSNYTSPRSAASVQSPNGAMSAMSPHTIPSAMNNLGPNASYQQFSQHFSRHNYPPVNPADQNPPCNTLYVGNLPIDTSEDELKAMFSKQRGYKRLCFRTKQNGPMCFVEFEDISFATKALNELYGHPLHNSVKGGIRLSFSKNPLGVRTGQSSSMASPNQLPPAAVMPGFGGNLTAPPGFTTATRPPPGLSAPPGLSTPVHTNGSSNFGMFANGGFGGNDMASPLRAQPLGGGLATSVAGSTFGGMGGGYSAYTMER